MMKKWIAFILVLSLVGCSTQTYTMKPDPVDEPTKKVMQSFFIDGLAQSREIDAATVCNGVDKVVKVESHLSFFNGLLRFVSFGIYAPRQARVYCSE